MAMQHGAINLSQGYPDFEVSQELTGLVSHYMKQGLNQYAPMAGILPLRENIAAKVKNTYGCRYDPEEEVTITTGATEAIFAAITAVTRPGDEVIIFDPAYDSYAPAVTLSGGKPVHIPLDPVDFHIDWEAVQARIRERTRLIIVNTPHNPSGTILSQSDMEILTAVAKETGILILSDEVYEHITFDGNKHHSVLAYHELRERCAAVFSFGKLFHVTGWKTGYCIAPAWWTREIRKVHQFVTFSVNTPMQYALADFLANPKNYQGLGDLFQRKRDLFIRLMKGSSFTPVPCHGTYFQLMRYRKSTHMPDTAMADWLTREKGVAAIPVSAFYQNGEDHQLLRFCFAKNDATLEKATAILWKL